MSGFMKMQCWQDWIDIDADGNEYPRGFCEGEATETDREGWFAVYSAPGYMDRTDPVGPFETATEAIEACFDLYGDPEYPAEIAEYNEALAWAKAEDGR